MEEVKRAGYPMGRFISALTTAYRIIRLLASLLGFLIYMQYLKLRARIKRWSNKRAFKKRLKGLPPDLRKELSDAYGEVLKETVKVPGLGQFMSFTSRRHRK